MRPGARRDRPHRRRTGEETLLPPASPGWYLNLVEDSAVQVQVGDRSFAARARDARADERTALWKRMTSIGPSLDDFQRKSGREIPVVVLERI